MRKDDPGGMPALRGKGCYSRGYLPHFDRPDLVQMVTFRLAGALPAPLLVALPEALPGESDADRRRWIEEHLDRGHGACYLGDMRIAALVEDALLHFDGQRYRLLAWVIMPNHVHALIETAPGHSLPAFGRFIRSLDHLSSAVRDIHENPVKAGLVARAEDWPFSSAARAASPPGSAGVPPA